VRRVLAVSLLTLVTVTPAAAATSARIAFTSGDGIDVMNADGGARMPLLRVGDGRFAGQPAWSPDGSRIAYTAGGVDSGLSRIWTMAAQGTDRHPLKPRFGRNTIDQSPAWSPDGRRIAFSRLVFRNESVTASLIVTASDGRAPRTLVAERSPRLVSLTAPAWSPDGARLLYTRTVLRNDGYFHSALYSIVIGGSGRRLVARDASGGSFSPDGSMIAFSSTRDRNGFRCGSDECFYNGEIYVAQADGSGARRLTRSDAADESPAWSPDGARIAFHSDRNYPLGESPEIYSIGLDGSCLTWLTNGTPASLLPAWEPGAGRSSAPSGCGDAGRAPLVAIDLAPARAYSAATAYWVGPEAPSHLLLSEVLVERRTLTLTYDDCSRYRPQECHGILQLYVEPVCRSAGVLYHELAAARARRFRGAMLLRPGDPGADTFLIAGATKVDIGADGISAMAVVRALRPIDAAAPPSSFPRASLPRSFWRRALPVERAFRRHGRNVRATARAIGIPPVRVREALRVAQALRRLGPFHRLGC
jgi:sugar lactone lactonase YvrE